MIKDVLSLISSLEKASGPNRELDLKIHLPIGWRVPLSEVEIEIVRKGMETSLCPEYGHERPPNFFVPLYTSSIDAALELVPDGWECKEIVSWIIGGAEDVAGKYRSIWGHQASLAAPYPYCSVYSDSIHSGPFAVNRAIAVCIVALKARNPISVIS